MTSFTNAQDNSNHFSVDDECPFKREASEVLIEPSLHDDIQTGNAQLGQSYPPRTSWQQYVWNFLIGLIVILLFPLIFISIGMKAFISSMNLSDHGVEAVGTVIDYNPRWDNKGTGCSIIEYEVEGQAYTFSACGSWFDSGSNINILYDPNNPGSSASVASWKSLWLTPTIYFSLTGLFLVCVSLPGMIIVRKNMKEMSRPSTF